LDFSGPVRTCANLCEPQIFSASNKNIRQKEIAYANFLGVNRGVVTVLEPKGEMKGIMMSATRAFLYFRHNVRRTSLSRACVKPADTLLSSNLLQTGFSI
jgi:hypothetical protein